MHAFVARRCVSRGLHSIARVARDKHECNLVFLVRFHACNLVLRASCLCLLTGFSSATLPASPVKAPIPGQHASGASLRFAAGLLAGANRRLDCFAIRNTLDSSVRIAMRSLSPAVVALP